VKIWKVIVSVIVIFGAGVVTGGLLVASAVRLQPAPAAVAFNPPPSSAALPSPAASPAPGRQVFVQKVRSQLDLTPDQSAQVDAIMKASRDRMVKIMEPVSPQTREETRRVRQEIQAILTPAQKKKFNEIFKHKPAADENKERNARPQ
jgi:Spy/CpxP family protein refolding chaperone